MNNVIIQFEKNIERARSFGGLYSALNGLTTPVVDASDMLRYQIVMALSTLDHYIHELAREGMLEIYAGARQATPAYNSFQVSMGIAVSGVNCGGMDWLESVVRQKHGFLCFQHPDKVADAIRLISEIKLWDVVSVTMGMTASDLKVRLKLIVNRRNQIAHEADLDPSFPGQRWSIAPADATGVIDFIDRLCHEIHTAVV